MNEDPKVQRIIEWREHFTTLPDDQFFDIIRMYLGEVKTPYNKTNLIEDLSSFLRKEQNRSTIVKLLSPQDIKILTIIKFVPHLTIEKLADFFSASKSLSEVSARIINLEERLLVYTRKDPQTYRDSLAINPLLEDVLNPMLTLDVMLPRPVRSGNEQGQDFLMSPQFLASFISFFITHSDLCKADGSLKKRAAAEIQKIYADERAQKIIEELIKTFVRLNLVHETEKELVPDWKRLELFAKLPPLSQHAYLCAASCGHFSRRTLQANAQILADTLQAAGTQGFTWQTLVTLSHFMKERGGASVKESGGRFQQMLSRSMESEGTAQNEGSGDSGVMEAMLSACVDFGGLYCSGKTESGEEIFSFSPELSQKFPLELSQNDGRNAAMQKKGLLSIDAGFSITIMPGLSLEELLPLMRFMNIVQYDVAATYEIDRHSVMRAFDFGDSSKKIFEVLERYSAYGLPQNLAISVEEWEHSYSSASLYRGYILKVDESHELSARRNPSLAPRIKEVLAPGIFLLDFESDEEAQAVIAKSGLDFIGTIKTVDPHQDSIGFRAVFPQRLEIPAGNASGCGNVEEIKKHIQQTKEILAKMEMTDDQREGLADRIDRRIIVNEAQLRAGSVRFECLEAGGLDHTGKIHVLENACQTERLVEIHLESRKEPLIGIPVEVNKKSGNAEFVLRLEDTGEELCIPVSAAVWVKKIRGTVEF